MYHVNGLKELILYSLPRLINRFNVISSKISLAFFIESDKLILKFI